MASEISKRTADAVAGATIETALVTDNDRARIGATQKSARADNTVRCYTAQLRNFDRWAAARGHNVRSADMPIPPAVVESWLTERAERGSPWMQGRETPDSYTTLRVALSAIKAAHTKAGKRFDAADPSLVETLHGLRRTARNIVKQAAPLRPQVLADILASVKTEDLGAVRDAAMLGMLYVFALRREELAGLHLDNLGPDDMSRPRGNGIFTILPDAMAVTLYRSKGSQNRPVSTTVPRYENPRIVGAIQRWIALAGIEPGTPLLRGISSTTGKPRPTALGGAGIYYALRRTMLEYFLSIGTPEAEAITMARAYSGHSGRVGLVVAAVEAGVTDTAIAGLTRHKTLDMINRYGEPAKQLKTSPHKTKGVGV